MTSRNYCFTTFDVDSFAVPDVPNIITYCVFQHEKCPDTDRIHVQGYVELQTPMRMAGVKKLFNDKTLHLERRKGTPAQARDYCMKEDSRVQGPWEYGTWNDKQQGKRNDLVAVFDSVKAGKKDAELAEMHPAEFIRYHNGIRNLKFTIDNDKWSTRFRCTLKVIVLFGDSGTGKTARAYKKDPGLFKLDRSDSSSTIWFDGYAGQRTLLIDDFYGWIPWGSMLNYLDIYPVRLPIKGSHTYAAWERVYITSNTSWLSWWKKTGDHRAMERRIHKEVCFLENHVVDVRKNVKTYKTCKHPGCNNHSSDVVEYQPDSPVYEEYSDSY